MKLQIWLVAEATLVVEAWVEDLTPNGPLPLSVAHEPVGSW